ncbi:MAG: GntR family transcriptional regulator [Pirellulales bacterium]
MSDRIRDQIAERIIEGKLSPGARLVEKDLAREFDVSQAPVREALRELEQLRLVESEPYRGSRVRGIGDREMAEAYAVRGVLEQLAGETAAKFFHTRPASVAELRELADRLERSASIGDIDDYSACNMSFHSRIVDEADNSLLKRNWEALSFEARVRIQLKSIKDIDLVARAREHHAIIDALEAGDGATAGRLLRTHADQCLKRWQSREGEVIQKKCDQTVPAGALS